MLLQHLITFCRVVQEGSFTRAAQVLNLTQPSVTKQIGALEDHLGTELFSRQGKQVHLTPAGEIAYDYARQISHMVTQCETAIDELRSPGAGVVRIGSVGLIGLVTLPGLLADFAQEYPLVRFNVRTGNNQETVSMLLHGEVDLALVTTPVIDDRLDSRRLFDDPLLLVAAPGNRVGVGREIELADLGRLPMVAYSKGSKFRNFTDQMLSQLGISPNVVMEFDNHESVKMMVRLGFGVALEPESVVRADIDEGNLMAVKVQRMPVISRATTLILRRGERRSQTVEAFINLLERQLKRD